MSEVNLNENNEIENKKLIMLKTKVLLENALKLESITEGMFYRIKSGIDAFIYDLEEPLLKKSRTSHLSLNQIAENSQSVKIDKNDIVVKKIIDVEVDMLKQFCKFMSNKKKYTVHDFTQLLNAQQQIDKKFIKN